MLKTHAKLTEELGQFDKIFSSQRDFLLEQQVLEIGTKAPFLLLTFYMDPFCNMKIIQTCPNKRSVIDQKQQNK